MACVISSQLYLISKGEGEKEFFYFYYCMLAVDKKKIVINLFLPTGLE